VLLSSRRRARASSSCMVLAKLVVPFLEGIGVSGALVGTIQV
jgi:hypothetical protein